MIYEIEKIHSNFLSNRAASKKLRKNESDGVLARNCWITLVIE